MLIPRLVSGNVLDDAIDIGRLHACRGKAQGHIHGTSRNWPHTFRLPFIWDFLDRRIDESRPEFWARCGHWKFPRLSLDLLYSSRHNFADPTGLGPSLGAVLAASIYTVLKLVNYEEVNGSQDRDAHVVTDRPESPEMQHRDVPHTASTGTPKRESDGTMTRVDPVHERYTAMV